MKYRNELIISTKAGFYCWNGPYGDGGSRKYLMASIDRSLENLGLPYVDIFYHHRFDPETDLRETMLALRDIVLAGKAIYIGLSNYGSEDLKRAHAILEELHVPYVITQPSYSMLNRWTEYDHLLDVEFDQLHRGTITFSALEQGLLSNKYIDGIPEDSRAKNKFLHFLTTEDVTDDVVSALKKLDVVAKARHQTISQMALAWVLRDPRVTSTLIGVRTMDQLHEDLKALNHLEFTKEELDEIEYALK